MKICYQLGFVLILGLLSGCGGGNDSTPAQSNAAPDQPSTESGAPPTASTPRLAVLNQTPPTVQPANVRIDAEAELITLKTNYGHVEIERAPLAVHFHDETGKRVLSSVSQQPLAPLLTRVPLPTRLLGGWTQVMPQAPALYAPFTFMVGTALDAQFPATF